MNWNALVNELMSENNLSMHGFAIKCGMNHTTVFNIVSGKTTEVQFKTKNRIERAFGLKIDDSDPDNLIVSNVVSPVKTITEMTNDIVEKYGTYPRKLSGNYVLGTVTAGRGEVLDYENTFIEDMNYPTDSCFWYVIDKQNGDSMYPFLVENDKILVDRSYPRKLIKETDLVMVQYAGKGTVKFFSRSEDDANILVFYSSNGNVPPLILRKENCEYFKVVLVKKI